MIAQDQNPFQSSYIKPHHIIKKDSGHYFIDFGKDAFGALVLNFTEAPSDSLIVHLGEKLSGNDQIDRDPGGTIRYQKVILHDVPVNRPFRAELAPDGRNDRYPAVLLPDTFGRIMPFRYCEIENLQIPLTEMEISQRVYHYRFNDEASSFTSSDSVLNQVWDLCKNTIKATSFCGKYVDGDRERIPYEADALINQLSHYAVDSEYTLAQNTNAYFIDHPTWPTEWILQTVMLFYYDYLYTGNPEFLVKYYEHLKHKTLIPLAREDGLISTDSAHMTRELMEEVGFDIHYTGRPIENIVDWPENERDGYDMVEVNTVVNSFYYMNMKLMAEIAEVIGMKEDARNYYNRSVLVRKAINEKLFNSGTGLFVDGEGSMHFSLHANMFPLAFGIVPEERKGPVVSFIKSKGMACSVYGAQYLLEALYSAGEDQYAFHLMTTTEGDRNWWNMIRVGSTMTLEAWDAQYKPNLDWNHAWATAPANIITRRMWGITPAIAGFEKARIRPRLSALSSSSVKVPTIRGPIVAEYAKTENGGLYVLTLPPGMTGEFSSVYKDARMKLNGKPVKAGVSSVQLTEGTNRIELIDQPYSTLIGQGIRLP
ncbi:MAG: alpha-L-rhamnosidase-related protein [Bacteroidales bacterium]